MGFSCERQFEAVNDSWRATTYPPAHILMRTILREKQVVPCIGDSSLPDGMIVTPANRVPLSGMKLYELCSKGEVDFQVGAIDASQPRLRNHPFQAATTACPPSLSPCAG